MKGYVPWTGIARLAYYRGTVIPIGDSGVRRHRFPFVNVLILGANILVFAYEASLPTPALEMTFLQFGVIPAELTTGRDLPPPSPVPTWATIFTSMFLHGGWLHIGSNMLYLWVFGDNVEDRLGHLLYLLFYPACGIVAALAQTMVNPQSQVPMIGASGAIAGVLAAYLLLFPSARVTTLFLAGIFTRIVPVPAVLLVGLWFVLQLFSGVASLGAAEGGGVAYWAHIGGFVAGLVLALPFRFLGPRRRTWERWDW